MLALLAAAAVAYFVGFPYGYIAANVLKGVDLRKSGSGNLGASNTLRVLGKKAGIAVLVADMLKGVAMVMLLPLIFHPLADGIDRELFVTVAAGAVIAGHNWPLLIGFKGGKGVAVTVGVFLALAPTATLLALAILVILVAIFRYISVGSMVFGLSLPPLMWIFHHDKTYIWLAVLAAAAIVFQHRGNIGRLIKGTENRLGQKTQ